MNEPIFRLGLVPTVLVLGLVVGIWLKGKARARPASARTTSLSAGVYLFTSRDCLDCVAARAELRELLPGGSFVEIAWEESPSLFGGLGVDVVPTTVIVGGDRSATVHPGAPVAALRQLNP